MVDGERDGVRTGELENRPVPEVERVAVERRIQEAGNQQQAAVTDRGVAFPTGRGLVAYRDSERLSVRRGESHGEPRGCQAEGREVRDGLLDDAPDLQAGHAAGDRRRRVAVGRRIDRRRHDPVVRPLAGAR